MSTDAEVAAIQQVLYALEPLDDIGRVRVLGAVALIFGHYRVAEICLVRAEYLDRREAGRADTVAVAVVP